MSLKDVESGRYSARVIDWDVIEVEKLDGKLQLAIKFGFEPEDDRVEEIWWKGFFQKKDGEPSKKTLETLMTCGFKYKKFADIGKVDALDTEKELEVTIEKNENDYHEVQWVNEPGASAVAGALGKEEGAKKLAGLDSVLGGELAKLRQEKGGEAQPKKKQSKKKVKNHATGEDVEAPGGIDEDEEIPF